MSFLPDVVEHTPTYLARAQNELSQIRLSVAVVENTVYALNTQGSIREDQRESLRKSVENLREEILMSLLKVRQNIELAILEDTILA